MTDKRPFTLTIKNGGRAVISAGTGLTATIKNADNANLFADRLRARAEVSVAYAALLGVNTAQGDVFDTLRAKTREGASDRSEADAIVTGLRATGLMAEVQTVTQLRSDQLPALAYMTSGQVVLVLGMTRGELTLYDKTCTDNRATVSVHEFLPFFAGLLVRAEAPLERVAQTHQTARAKPHWFWGEFHRFRKALGEIALGSFVANLLAVSVALFSLQVYDRVIPHQSEATLWVLA
ncbi:MAG: ABC transporter ATP-binding protein, partial [Pseudomonadota bacterium]